MFHVYELPRQASDRSIAITSDISNVFDARPKTTLTETYGEDDIDFVDDTLLNTAPHNAIEKQLLRGDMVGLALMSSAIIWSAMGAFG